MCVCVCERGGGREGGREGGKAVNTHTDTYTLAEWSCNELLLLCSSQVKGGH